MVIITVSCPPQKPQLLGLTLGDRKGGGGIIQISEKEKLFRSHKKIRAIWGNLTLYHSSLPLSVKTFLFSSFGQAENIHGTY